MIRFSTFALATALSLGGALAQDEGIEIVPPASRDVTPPGVMPAPGGDGPLIREKVPPPPADGPRWRRFFLPIALDAGTIQVKDRRIKFADVVAPEATTLCEMKSGGPGWPCGRAALSALRMFLRGRAVECLHAGDDNADPLVALCRIGSIDIGLWLVRLGWAGAGRNASEDYQAAARLARCSNLGLWREVAREASCPGQ
jgi:endonuclease YncB( thermonuclease family)